MERTTLAVAMALVVAGFGLGLPSADIVSAQSSNCPAIADFLIADSQVSASERSLAGNSEEIGSEDVLAGNGETLNVELRTQNDQLDWTVYHKNATDDCVKFDPTNCDRTIDTKSVRQQCDLDPPSSGSKTYWVEFANPESDALKYMAWVD